MNKVSVYIKSALLAILVMTSLQARAAVTFPSGSYLSYEERVLVSYALSAYQKPEAEKQAILQRGQHYFQTAAARPVTEVEVNSFEEFLTHFRGEWPNSGDLELDLRRIESQPIPGRFKYKSSNASVQQRIDGFLSAHRQTGMSLYMQNSQNLAGASTQDFNNIAEHMIGQQMEEFNTIGTKVASSDFNVIQDPLTKILLQTLFNDYFRLQTLDSKKQMISAMMGEDLGMNDQAKLELMIQNSGPQFQKLLQIMVRQGGLPDELKATFKKLENATRPVPWWQVQEIVAGETSNYNFVSIEQKPLGVGTMAQVHRAKLNYKGKVRDVVIRFIKPNIDKRVEDDHRILSVIAQNLDSNSEYRRNGGAKMVPLIDDITQTVRAELDQDATIKRQLKAKKVYETTAQLNSRRFRGPINFHVPDVYRSERPSKLMVQEMVSGQSLDKEAAAYATKIPELKRGIIEEMAKVWAHEIIFGSGFYHSDLHQGNFLVKVQDSEVDVNILDYGMGGVLNQKTRNLLVFLGAALQLKDADLITQAYWGLSDKSGNQVTKAELQKLVEKRLSDLDRQRRTETVEYWTGWASDNGVKLPYDFINLNRGILIVNKSLEDAGSSLNFTSIQRQMAQDNPMAIYSALVSSDLMSMTDFLRLGISSMGGNSSRRSTRNNGPAAPLCESVFLVTH